jgi:hypothetical protein
MKYYVAFLFKTKQYMQKITWDDIWYFILVGTVIGIITLIGVSIIKDSKIDRYVLTSRSSDTGIVYGIQEKRIWGLDRQISLDTHISLDSTIKIIDHLNEQLKK